MSEASMNDVTTHAFNFVSAQQGQVDPRTGLFMFNFNLGKVSYPGAPDLSLPIVLSYSPQQTANSFSLGNGFSLGFTSYSPATRQLILSTGEQFRVDEHSNNTCSIDQHQLDTTHIYKITDTNAVNDYTYFIKSKNGICETLRKFGNDVYLPVRIESPLGYVFALSWGSEHGRVMLKSIVTVSAKPILLCSLSYKSTVSAKITFFPFSKEKYEIQLDFTNTNLTKITNNTANQKLSWTLNYDLNCPLPAGNDAVYPLNRITSPTGMEESVIYTPGKMKFNDNNGSGGMPAVSEHLISSGNGVPDTITTYSYSDTNYLGNGASFMAFNKLSDNLYNLLTSYIYTSTETQKTASGSIAQTTVRSYNNYHLLIKEETQRNNKKLTQETEHYAIEGKPFSQQPATFQMPKSQKKTWSDGTNSRQEITTFEYDTYGNLTRQTAPDGTVTLISYYEAGGEQNKCPADPDGFCRWMKSKCVFPPVISGDEPSVNTAYIYRSTLLPAGKQHGYAITLSDIYHAVGIPEPEAAKAFKNGGVINWSMYTPVMTSMKHTRVNEDVHSPFFGNVLVNDLTTYDESHTATAAQSFHYEVDENKETLTLTEEHSVHEAPGDPGSPLLMTTASSTVSMLTGRKLAETDALKSTTHFTYDELGRLLTTTRQVDRQGYTASEHYRYRLGNSPFINDDIQAFLPTSMQASILLSALNTLDIALCRTLHCDIKGNLTLVSYDSTGRGYRLWINDSDAAGNSVVWRKVKENLFDEFGRKVKSITCDYLRDQPAGQETIRSSLTREWDDWGQCNLTDSDGIKHRVTSDPIALTTLTWAEGSDGTKTALQKVTFDTKTSRPVKTELFAEGIVSGAAYSTTSCQWDGAGRMRLSTDTLGQVTRFFYDALSRQVRVLYPDQSSVDRTYAPYDLQGKLQASISVTPGKGNKIVLGHQMFDGLGRLLSTSSGGRTFTYHYDLPTSRQPLTVTGPDGVVTTHTYDPLLDNALTGLTTTAGPDGKKIEQSFTYNRVTRQPEQAVEGNTRLGWQTFTSGFLQQETVKIHDSSTQAAPNTHYQYSVAGLIQKSSDFNQTEQTHFYETQEASRAGFLTKVSDPAVTVTLSYDTLNRVQSWTVKENTGSASLTTALKYDSFGREICRTIKHSNGECRTLVQAWRKDNLLVSRTLSLARTPTGPVSVLSDESYTWDSRNRMVEYDVKGDSLPVDSYGNPMLAQNYSFDCLNNIITCSTLLSDNTQNNAYYAFENKEDPCQLTSLTNSLTTKGYPEKITLMYDKCGRMTRDEAGRTLTYDALGRLAKVSKDSVSCGEYGYDARNRLSFQMVDRQQQLHRLYYQGDRLINEWMTKGDNPPNAVSDTRIRFVYGAGGSVAQVEQTSGSTKTLLTGTDAKKSVIIVGEEDKLHQKVYTPYGYTRPEEDKSE